MAGFGESKKVQQKASEEPADPFADLRTELADVNANRPKTHIFMALVGQENTGKSAIIFDFFQRYCDSFDTGRQTNILEFTEVNK